MCTYLEPADNGVYYFRRGIPEKLRPFFGGKREFKHSLRTKDRETAKRLIPDHTKASQAQLDQAQAALDAASSAPAPVLNFPAQLGRERLRTDDQEWQDDQASADLYAQDMEIETLEPILDAISEGLEPNASPAEIAKAAQLDIRHEREMAQIDREIAANERLSRYAVTVPAVAPARCC